MVPVKSWLPAGLREPITTMLLTAEINHKWPLRQRYRR
jgi:hypothetical protein